MNLFYLIVIISFFVWFGFGPIKMISGLLLFLFILSYFEPRMKNHINKFTELFNQNIFTNQTIYINKYKEEDIKSIHCGSCYDEDYIKNRDNRSTNIKTDNKFRSIF